MRILSLNTAVMILVVVGLLGTAVLADDGGTMAQLMGHDAYVAMVEQMRATLGNERADAMIARCESQLAGAAGGMMSDGMMGGRR